jgi:16S rRNA (adenine1518-N6/adenine1519-N6)-dimethyltransferase
LFSRDPEKRTLIHGDALEQNILLMIENRSPIRIFGNLPFNVATRLLINWMDQFHRYRIPFEAIIMLQSEVADRICLKEGNSERSRLAVLMQNYCEPRIRMTISSASFTPRPRVDASVLHLVTRHQPHIPVRNFDQFVEFLRILFAMKRKTVRQNLTHHLSRRGCRGNPDETIAALGDELLSLRPQDLSLSQIRVVYDWWISNTLSTTRENVLSENR